MEEEIKAGDLVQLKTGSIPMTVLKVDGGDAVCSWGLTNDDKKSKRIPLSLLEKIS